METLFLVYFSFSLWETALRARQDTHPTSCACGMSHGRMSSFHMEVLQTRETLKGEPDSRKLVTPPPFLSSYLSITQMFLGSPTCNIAKYGHLLLSDSERKIHQRRKNCHEEAFCNTTGYIQRHITSHNPATQWDLVGEMKELKERQDTHKHTQSQNNQRASLRIWKFYIKHFHVSWKLLVRCFKEWKHP